MKTACAHSVEAGGFQISPFNVVQPEQFSVASSSVFMPMSNPITEHLATAEAPILR